MSEKRRTPHEAGGSPLSAGDGFVDGLTLARHFYERAVRPILRDTYPELTHAAALIGPGSEVLGFDTPRSTDHHWGPRVMLFLRDADLPLASVISATLADALPHEFLGWPTSFTPPDDAGVQLLQATQAGPVRHRIEIHTAGGFFDDYLGWDAAREPSVSEWLAFPQHRLRAVTSGAVFSDPDGALERARARLAWYPDDLWRHLLASEWEQLAEIEPFLGRCAELGDELGARLIASRLAERLMRLSFLLERSYAPYAKWFASAFHQLALAAEIGAPLAQLLATGDAREREDAWVAAATDVARAQNRLGISAPQPASPSPFHDRPYLVIHGERFAAALRAAIHDPQVRALPSGIGALDQLAGAATALEAAEHRERVRELLNPTQHPSVRPSPPPAC